MFSQTKIRIQQPDSKLENAPSKHLQSRYRICISGKLPCTRAFPHAQNVHFLEDDYLREFPHMLQVYQLLLMHCK